MVRGFVRYPDRLATDDAAIEHEKLHRRG
jgi:hypothetical protein